VNQFKYENQERSTENFKRFTDLRIENIPEETKLVLLIGTNGSGKSSVFDGFRYSTLLLIAVQRTMGSTQTRNY
jgi:AAA15 family ATPase/GTPase